MLHAHHAYAQTAKTGLGGAALVAATLRHCAVALQRAAEAGDADGGLVEALERNRRAWSVLADEMAWNTELSAELRASVARFATLVFRETFEICNAPSPAGARSLAAINRTVADALQPRAA